MVMHTQTHTPGIARRALQGLLLLTLITFSAMVVADTAEDERLRAEMEEARQQLDEATQRMAEISRKMAGGEVARVVKRMSLGQRKAMLGVRIDDALDGEGVRINSVTPDGPAERAGVQKGDLLRSINGVSLTSGTNSEAIDDLLKTLRKIEPEEVASLVILRDGREMNIDVKTESVAEALPRFGTFTDSEGNVKHVGEMLENLAIRLPNISAGFEVDGKHSQFSFDGSAIEDLNQLPQRLEEAMGKLAGSAPVIAMLGGSSGLGHKFRFAPVTSGLGGYFGVDRGVLLTAVPEEGALGMQEGDVLLSINGEPVDSKYDVNAAFAQADEGETLAVELVRQRESITLDVTAPGNPWGRAWKCRTEEDADGERKRCESKDGRSYSFRFSLDDD